MEFSRLEYWSGLPFPTPGDLPDPGIQLASLASSTLAGGFFITSATWEAHIYAQVFSYVGIGNDNPLQYSCLENPMDREAWKATVHGVTRVRHDLRD